MEESTCLLFNVPCEILEFDLEIVPEGLHPEMEAFTSLIDRLSNGQDVPSSPISAQVRMIRKGFLRNPLFDFPSKHSPPPEGLSVLELVEFFRKERIIDTITFQVVRDLQFGTLSGPKSLGHRLQEPPSASIELEQIVPSFENMNKNQKKLIDLIEPHRRKLSYLLDVDYYDVPKRINLVGEIRIKEGVSEKGFYLRENKYGQKSWVAIGPPYDVVSNKLKATHPRLVNHQSERREEIEWDRAHEGVLIDELQQCATLLGKSKPKEKKFMKEVQEKFLHLAELLKKFHSVLDDSSSDRLASVLPVVGTEIQQWDAAIEVIQSADHNALLLSAFTNVTFVDHVRDCIRIGTENKAELTLVAGEPNRVNEVDYIKQNADYATQLQHGVTTTELPSHAKFVVSDTGKFWLGSCNLLSSAPGSQNSEVGVLVNDARAAIKLLEHVEPWFRKDEQKTIQRMKKDLGKIEPPPKPSIDELLVYSKHILDLELNGQPIDKKTKKTLNHLIRDAKDFVLTLLRRPRYNFLDTKQHRSFVIDSVASVKSEISLASDQLRPTGFDPTLRNLVLGKYTTPNPDHLTFQTRIYWGRQWAESSHLDNEVKEGQKLLDELRRKCKIEIKTNSREGKMYNVRFFPRHTKGPMSNHAKFLVADGIRVLITSLNLFGGKNEELDLVDATELGIVIDCNRLADVITGEMDLMMGPEYFVRSFQQLQRMFTAALHTALLDRKGKCTLEQLMDEFFSRVFDTDHLRKLWNDFMQKRDKKDSLREAIKLLRGAQSRFFMLTDQNDDDSFVSFARLLSAMSEDGFDDDLSNYTIKYKQHHCEVAE